MYKMDKEAMEMYLMVIRNLKDDEVNDWIDCYLHQNEWLYHIRLEKIIEDIIDRMEKAGY